MQGNSSEGMHRADIVAAIERAGYTQESLSTLNGFSKSAVSVALAKPWPAVEKIIADTIGVAAHLIWPPRYDRAGVPIKRGGTKVSRGSKHGPCVKKRCRPRAPRATA